MLISNYGLFWQRKYVNFGCDGNKGTLLGKISKKKLLLVDFGEQVGIYVLYDKDFIPIYVGQAGNGNGTLLTRLQLHTTDYLSDRWEYFTWFGLRRVNANKRLAAHDSIEKKSKAQGGSILDESEGILMATMEPKLNRQGLKRKDTAEEYRQAVDENSAEISIEDVIAGIEELKKRKKTIEKRLNKKSK